MSKKYRKDQVTLYANLSAFLYKIKITLYFIIYSDTSLLWKSTNKLNPNDFPFREINSCNKDI